MINIFAIGIGCGNNSTSNEEFPVKILEDQQKKLVLHYLLYDK